ncbi:MAG: transposase [Culicoidibacterales bacterium]
MDESKLSKRKFNVGRVVRSPWVIGGVDIVTGDMFFKEVLFRNRSTIASVLSECVEIGSTIITDCWSGYVNLEELGYIHMTVNHS